MDIALNQKKSITIPQIAALTKKSVQTIYNYQKDLWEISPHQPFVKAMGSNFQNDIYDSTLSNILRKKLGTAGLADFGFLPPPLSIDDAIKFLFNDAKKITKESIAELVGCSVSTVKRSHSWKHYTYCLKEYKEEKEGKSPSKYEDLFPINRIIPEIHAAVKRAG